MRAFMNTIIESTTSNNFCDNSFIGTINDGQNSTNVRLNGTFNYFNDILI